MEVPVYNTKGEAVSKIELRDDIFGLSFNESVVHQALVRQLANQRLGAADTKTRSEVQGSGRKLFRQKHTGLARRGDRRSPILRGGGVVFGPHPRDYTQAMPKKMRQLALRCVLSDKIREGKLKVVDKLKFKEPKTKKMADFLVAMEVDSSALIGVAEAEPNLIRSVRNLPNIKALPVTQLNIADLLSYGTLILTTGAVAKGEKLWGQRQAKETVTVA